MKGITVFILMLTAATQTIANDNTCEIDILKSQGQLIKATSNPSGNDFNRISDHKPVSLPEVKATDIGTTLITNDSNQDNWMEKVKDEDNGSGSKLGNMFELLVPAKLRNPSK